MDVKVDWEAVRRQPYANVETPEDWPKDVRPINWHGINLLGTDGTCCLYWDGKKIKTEIKLGWIAASIGGLIAFFTFLAAIATVSMAVIDLMRFLNGQ